MNARLSRPGEVHGRHRLTEAQVRDIRHRYATWVPRPTQFDLALDFGVSQGAVWKVVTRKTWRHVR
jgi:hypothetical protein